MTSFDQARRGLTGDQKGAVVALRQAVADPEHAASDLAWQFVRHSLALLVARDIARHCDTFVASFEKFIKHLVMPRHYFASAQNATVAGRDGLDLVFVKYRVDAAADLASRRAFQPPIARV